MNGSRTSEDENIAGNRAEAGPRVFRNSILIMNGIGLHTFVNIFYDHWLSAFLICVTLATIGVIFVLRWYVRRRLRALMENRFGEDHELDLLPSPGPREQESLELIARFREEVWEIPEGELQLALDPLTRRAVTIIRAIGGVYHPEAGQPEYEASLTDTMELVKRVSTRLSRLASAVPFRYLGDRKLSDFQRYYQVYLKINENRVSQNFQEKSQPLQGGTARMEREEHGKPPLLGGTRTHTGRLFLHPQVVLPYLHE